MKRNRNEKRCISFLNVALTATLSSLFISGCSLNIRRIHDAVATPSPVPTSTTWLLSNGDTSINLRASPSRDSTIYYAVFNSDQGTLTANQVKAAAQSCSGACKAGGSFAATTSGTTQTISGVADKSLYSVYAVHEDTEGLAADSDVKHYQGVVSRRLAMQTFVSALNSKLGFGQTVRYHVYLPPGYYDHPTTNYPVIMYVHGGGERSNDAANPESDMSLMLQSPFAGLITSGTDYNAIFVQPQCNEALWNCVNTDSTNYLAEVIDQVNATFRTNIKKYAIVGMSWGGAGALHLTYDYPSKISAVVAIAGGLFYTGTRPAAASDLCPRFATNKVALWAVNNLQDPWYSPGAVTGGGGTYPGTIVSTITANCTGYPDARFTEYNDNTTFPVNFMAHLILEFTLGNSPYFDYGTCSGGNAWKSWNGTVCAADSTPPAYRIPLHPVMAADLQTASTALTGSSSTLSSFMDWLLIFEKP